MINRYNILNSAKYFVEDASESYLVSQPVFRYIEMPTNNGNMVYMSQKSKRFSDESIKPPATSDDSLNPRLDYFNNPKLRVKSNGSCLKFDKTTLIPNKIMNLYITFEIKSWPCYGYNLFVLRNFLFGVVTLTKNADPDKYPYSGYGISFDVPGTSSW